MLRIILCFLVVYRHTYTGERTFLVGYLYALSTSAVPVFMMLSFYLTAKHIERWDWSYVCERNVRLMIPMWGGGNRLFWSIISNSRYGYKEFAFPIFLR